MELNQLSGTLKAAILVQALSPPAAEIILSRLNGSQRDSKKWPGSSPTSSGIPAGSSSQRAAPRGGKSPIRPRPATVRSPQEAPG